jgi:hypothetical protein
VTDACKAIAAAGLKTTLMLFGAGFVLIAAGEAINWSMILREARKAGL